MSKDPNKVREEIHLVQGKLNYHLERFGDELAKKENYGSIDGMDAVWLYLIKKYNWTPVQVRAMHPEDIRFVLTTEMNGWRLKD